MTSELSRLPVAELIEAVKAISEGIALLRLQGFDALEMKEAHLRSDIVIDSEDYFRVGVRTALFEARRALLGAESQLRLLQETQLNSEEE